MIFDSHCHAWERWPYDRTVTDGSTRGSAGALLHEMDAQGVSRALIIAARIGDAHIATNNAQNNAYVAEWTMKHPDRFCMAADVDSFWLGEHHTDGAASRLRQIAGETAAVAFTHYSTGPDDGWFHSPEGIAMFSAAASLGLVASLHAPPPWHASVAAIARANPTLPVLLHHQGLATTDEEIAALGELAAIPNLYIKVSGFSYLTDRPWDYPFPAVIERLGRLHKAFGADRLVWGSDFPVSRKNLSYRQTLEIVREHCDFLDDDEVVGVLGGNLQRILTEVSPA